MFIMSKIKVKGNKKNEKRASSPMGDSSETKTAQDSDLLGMLNHSNKGKKAHPVKGGTNEDSLSLSFMNNLQLSEEKESDKKSVMTKATIEQAPVKVDNSDPLVKQVKEVTEQVKSEHQNFLSNLKEILQENSMEFKCVSLLYKNFEKKLNRLEEKTCLEIQQCIDESKGQAQGIEILQVPESLLKA